MLNQEQKTYFLERLCEFLKIRSISADPECQGEMLEAALFLKKELVEAQFPAIELLFAKGLSGKSNNPVLFAEKMISPNLPTVLIYGHYDVQPVEPLEEWKSPPFEPEVRAGKIFARGATDDKGQLFTHIVALQLLSQEKLPLNIKILIEGEEENGGENLKRLIEENSKKFKADVCLVSDTSFISKNKPAIEIGLRGIVYFEMKVVTAKQDLHSGLFGGGVYNPLNLITKIMGIIQKEFTDERLRKEPENARYPSFDIHGIRGGYVGDGSKTVIPKEASVKFSLRIIGGQDPNKIAKQVLRIVKTFTPKGVDIDLKVLGKAEAFSVSGGSRYLQLAEESMKRVFGQKPTLTRKGGSIPIVADIAKHLEAEVILMGYGLPDDNLHSPNEKMDLDQFYKGIECNMEFLRQMAK
jgi:acetylornithine deacetylase/succinyl-diaminopimelate desuccinylase-like protein